jgi:lipoprotein-anchoring transpeptidase ErfK/SrfK
VNRARWIVAALLLGACIVEEDGGGREAASAIGAAEQPMAPEDLERGRLDAGWRQYVVIDSADSPPDTTPSPETWDDITSESLGGGAVPLAVHTGSEGPAVTRLQILLDRVRFSPGIIDGKWGKNTEKAVYWLQRRERLTATGRADSTTMARLQELAGMVQLVTPHTLTAEDVAGPFVEIPQDVHERAALECLCFESLPEKLAERFHTTPELLGRLNPGVDLASLAAGDVLTAPAVGDTAVGGGQVAEIVVSDGGHFLHARDADGRILYHFPSTLGSSYAPTPAGEYDVTRIARDPTWHYQPELLTGVPDHEEDAVLPAGPNSPVGLVWIALSRPHYGIHGTNAPETIGYATSNGCVRLTNWDALFLAGRIRAGIPVVFRDATRAAGIS